MASIRSGPLLSQLLSGIPRLVASTQRQQLASSGASLCRRQHLSTTPRRLAHTIPRPRPRPAAPADANGKTRGTSNNKNAAATAAARSNPCYELTFTCIPCGHRSGHSVSKQGYHHGTVLITCPSCRNRHLISDHLGIFGDRRVTVEDILRERGRLVKRGTLGEDGDLEFWEDGTVTQREMRSEPGSPSAVGEEAEAARLREMLNRPPGSSFKTPPGDMQSDQPGSRESTTPSSNRSGGGSTDQSG
ncbi:hypothetical protein VTK73DRAFT_1642 [Phialemonium thermophilum]|uniref:DNL-type domain-containing protein n=1 Tax=Phialemonium thermophilum TaxID=223376 RepID=A0ABR3X9J5_9PEZI